MCWIITTHLYPDHHAEPYLLSATALTVDNILRQLKEVKWETLRGGTFGGVLRLPRSQRRKIEAKYAGETERKREGVKYWLWNCAYASWRWLIAYLDREKEHSVADKLRGYAEKLTGMLGQLVVLGNFIG